MFSTPYFSSFTGGQTIIPVGARGFTIKCVSGVAYAAGVPLFPNDVFSWTAPDSKNLLGSTIAVGTTGAANRVTVLYTT